MRRHLSLKLTFAAAILLVVVQAVASSHAHEGTFADEPCSVCVASADLAPAALAAEPVSAHARAQREPEATVAAPLPTRQAAYAARAPPSS